MGEAGHTFLAKLGKTRLRPGGKEATDWLIDKGYFQKDKKVLEVACNICTTSIMLAKRYGCEIEAVDLNKKALEKGEQNKAKEKALAEYYRVLKPGGILLTHDIAILAPEDTAHVQKQLSDAINVKVTPLPVADWTQLYKEAGFKNIDSKIGSMSLMTPSGMIRDEGILGTMKIIRNALKKENRPMFTAMFKAMNQLKARMNYIVFAARK